MEIFSLQTGPPTRQWCSLRMETASNLSPGLPVPDNQWVLMTKSLTECLSVLQMNGFLKKAATPLAGHVLQGLFQGEEGGPLLTYPCSEASSELEVTEGIWEYGELDKSSIFEQQKE